MVKYGMTPMQAIQSATSSAADLLGKSNLLDPSSPGNTRTSSRFGNPLEDIRVLENVKFVMKEGNLQTGTLNGGR